MRVESKETATYRDIDLGPRSQFHALALAIAIGDASQTYGTPADLSVQLPGTINTGVNGENLAIAYTSDGDIATAHVGNYEIDGFISDGTGLADNMGEGVATGSEWRTSPLWSIGLTPGVSGGEAYLHDGRARSLEEAILWHGGEAQAAEENFRNMSASDRAALIAFLKSL